MTYNRRSEYDILEDSVARANRPVSGEHHHDDQSSADTHDSIKADRRDRRERKLRDRDPYR